MNQKTKSKLLLITILLLTFTIYIFGKINETTLVYTITSVVAYLSIELLISTYINFILKVRDTKFFEDNRTTNFLTWDILKFALIFFALLSVLVLGLNRILNNEIIATLLGGLVGSLLTLKGSYVDFAPKQESNPNEKPVQS